MVFSSGVIFTVFMKRDHMNTASRHIQSQIYQKAQSSQVVKCLLMFSEMAELVLARTGQKVTVDKLLI